MSAPLLPVRPLYPLARQAFAPGKLCCCFEDPPSALLMWCATLFLLQATLHSSFAFLTPPTTYLPHPPSFSPCIMNLGGAYLFGVTMQHAQGKPEFQAEPAAVWWGTLKGALICSACASGMAAGVNEGIAAAVVASSHSGFGFLWGLASVPIMLVGAGVTMTWSAVSAVYARRKIRARLGLPNSDLADALTGCCCHSCQMTQDFRTAVALANESGSATAWTPILSQTTTTTTTTTSSGGAATAATVVVVPTTASVKVGGSGGGAVAQAYAVPAALAMPVAEAVVVPQSGAPVTLEMES